MPKLAFLLLVLCTPLITIQMVYSTVELQKQHDQWLTSAEEKLTHLHFYLHNIPSSPNPTSVMVVSGANGSQTLFGAISMIDDLLTQGPKPTSNPVGRAQGLVGLCGLDEVVFCMSVNLVFTTGKFSGSSLGILGRNLNRNPAREMAVVGGTGAFRLARGFLKTTTFYLNTTTNNGIYEYNVVAFHY